MIHVCFGFMDKTLHYSKFVGTTMCSIFENNTAPPPSISVHILHDNTLTQDNREKFVQLTESYGQIVRFHNVENDNRCADVFEQLRIYMPKALDRRYTIGAFYRCVIPFVLPESIEKAIYLDGDTIVNLDINELWQIDLEDKVCGVVTVCSVKGKCQTTLCLDGLVNEENYFNSGMIVMNLKILRGEKETLMNAIKFIGENPRYHVLPDEDVLNYAFASSSLKLPKKFNSYKPDHERRYPIKPQIYHYVGRLMNLNKNLNYNRLWVSYFVKTPFFNEETIYGIKDGFDKIYSELQTFAAKLSSIVLSKTRAFFVEPSRIESMKEIFSIRDDELIIPAENAESILKLIDVMKSSQGTVVFFIVMEKFLKKKFPFYLLTKEGFVENKDFVNVGKLVSPFDSYPLIANM